MEDRDADQMESDGGDARDAVDPEGGEERQGSVDVNAGVVVGWSQEEVGADREDMFVPMEQGEETGGQEVDDGRDAINGDFWNADVDGMAWGQDRMGSDGELTGLHDKVEFGERDKRVSGMDEEEEEVGEENEEDEEDEESDADELVMSLRQQDISRQHRRTRQRAPSASNTDEFLDDTDN